MCLFLLWQIEFFKLSFISKNLFKKFYFLKISSLLYLIAHLSRMSIVAVDLEMLELELLLVSLLVVASDLLRVMVSKVAAVLAEQQVMQFAAAAGAI